MTSFEPALAGPRDRRQEESQGSWFLPQLWYGDPFHRTRSIRPVAQLPMQLSQQVVFSARERGDGDAIYASAALVLPDMFPRLGKIDRIIDLVDQRMDFPMPFVISTSSAAQRLQGILDAGAGSFASRTCPHFRHVLTRSSPFATATQHGVFPLRAAFWVRSAPPLQGDDPRPFVLTSFKSTSSRSDSWHRIGRNFACAYIRTYLQVAPGRALRSLFLALSSASVALSQPYLLSGQYQVSLSY